MHSDMLPKAVHDEIEQWRHRAIRSLMNDDDNDCDDDDLDDHDLNDYLAEKIAEFDKLLAELDLDDDDLNEIQAEMRALDNNTDFYNQDNDGKKPAKKTKRNKKK